MQKPKNVTPAMAQFYDIKEQYPANRIELSTKENVDRYISLYKILETKV